MLGFIAGKFDMMTLPPTLLKDVKSQAPEAICDRVPDNAARSLILNRAAPPFDNSDLRRAMALSLDRKAFIDILGEGQGAIGGAMLPPPEGVWGMPLEILSTLRGYDPDVPKNRAEARQIMQKLGFGPDKRLAVTVSTRNVPVYRDPAVILIDQLKEVYIDGVLDIVPTVNWYPKVARKDYGVGLSISENSLDEPDQSFYENYVCGAEHNYTGYCNPEIDKLIDEQSMVSDQEKRQRLVWDIERKLAEDGAQPIIFYGHYGICWRPQLKGLTLMVNSLFNGWRMEDVWLDK
jgi:peptide/nickel transport system substrate-binding protein